MDIRLNDVLEMKKQHPCGGKSFLVLRVGMDFKLRCTSCGREVMVARSKAEKNIKKAIIPMLKLIDPNIVKRKHTNKLIANVLVINLTVLAPFCRLEC